MSKPTLSAMRLHETSNGGRVADTRSVVSPGDGSPSSSSSSSSSSSTSLSLNGDEAVFTTPVIFQTIHVDVHENQRWFPIVGWGTSRLPNDPPNFSLVQLSDAALDHRNTHIAPHVAAFQRAFHQMMLNEQQANRALAGAARTINAMRRASTHAEQAKDMMPEVKHATPTELRTSQDGYASIDTPVRPLHITLPPGYAWDEGWEVVLNHPRGTDAMGWRYAPEFYSTREVGKNSEAASPESQSTSMQRSRAHFKATQSALCVVRYRTWRRRVRVTSTPMESASKRASSASTYTETNDRIKDTQNSPVIPMPTGHAHSKPQDSHLAVAQHPLAAQSPEHTDVTHVPAQADGATHHRGGEDNDHAELAKPRSTGRDTEEVAAAASRSSSSSSKNANTLYIRLKEDEMMLAQQLKARRVSRLHSGQPWTSQDDLAAEEELRSYTRERRAESGGTVGLSHGSASCRFGNPFDSPNSPSSTAYVVGKESTAGQYSSPTDFLPAPARSTARATPATTAKDGGKDVLGQTSSPYHGMHVSANASMLEVLPESAQHRAHPAAASAAEENLRASFVAGQDASAVVTTTPVTSLGNRPASGMDGLQTQQRVSLFVPASPNSRLLNESDAVTWPNDGVVVDDNDFDSVFHKFVSNPENSSTTQ